MQTRSGRYSKCAVRTLTTQSGQPINYLSPRRVPLAAQLPSTESIQVRQGDRPDTLAARALGDPLKFWRLADANDVIAPDKLDQPVGRLLRVPQALPGQ